MVQNVREKVFYTNWLYNSESGLCNQKGTKRRALPQEMQDTLKLSSQTAAIATFMER